MYGEVFSILVWFGLQKLLKQKEESFIFIKKCKKIFLFLFVFWETMLYVLTFITDKNDWVFTKTSTQLLFCPCEL